MDSSARQVTRVINIINAFLSFFPSVQKTRARRLAVVGRLQHVLGGQPSTRKSWLAPAAKGSCTGSVGPSVQAAGFRLRGRIAARNFGEPCARLYCLPGNAARSAGTGWGCSSHGAVGTISYVDSCAPRALGESNDIVARGVNEAPGPRNFKNGKNTIKPRTLRKLTKAIHELQNKNMTN